MDDGGLLRFRCRVGHAFSGDGVRAGYTESVEAALWSAVRSLEESAALENRLGELALERGCQERCGTIPGSGEWPSIARLDHPEYALVKTQY